MSIKHTFMGKGGLITREITPIRVIRAKCLECSKSGKKLTDEEKEELARRLGR